MSLESYRSLISNATRLVQRQGYAGFSYADLSEVVGLKKPSIHHHFPTKQDLGAAIVADYTLQFSHALAAIMMQRQSVADRISAYAGLYRAGMVKGQPCLCGVLASEMGALPEKVQAGIRSFFDVNLRWLDEVLAKLDDRARQSAPNANAILSSLQGATFLSLAMSDVARFDETVKDMLDRLN